MGKVYRAPEGFKAPDIGEFLKGKFDRIEYLKAERAYEDSVRQWARDNGQGKCKGEVVRFQVADGYATYVVMSLRPVKLIHLELGDAYSFQYVDRLTAADIRKQVDAEKSMGKLFGSCTDS